MTGTSESLFCPGIFLHIRVYYFPEKDRTIHLPERWRGLRKRKEASDMEQSFDPKMLQVDTALEIHNYDSSFNTYYNILTPLHLIVMYNTSGLPDVTDVLFSVSPVARR